GGHAEKPPSRASYRGCGFLRVPPAAHLQGGVVWLLGARRQSLGAVVEDLPRLWVGGRGVNRFRSRVPLPQSAGVLWSGDGSRCERRHQCAHTGREFLGQSKRLWRGERWQGLGGPGATIPLEAGSTLSRSLGRDWSVLENGTGRMAIRPVKVTITYCAE